MNDRLDKIEQNISEQDCRFSDIEWLIAEVRRLRNVMELYCEDNPEFLWWESSHA